MNKFVSPIGKVKWVHCFGHLIELAIEHFLECELVSKVQKNLKQTRVFLNGSPRQITFLEDFCKDLLGKYNSFCLEFPWRERL